ncbi:N/A [soil metagenome]
MIRQLAHVCLNVRDLDATTRFYRDVLGLPIRFTFEKEGRTVGMYFALGNDTFIEVFERDPATEVHNTGITHFCLETEHMTDLVKKLDDHGVAHTDSLLGGDHAYQVWFKDPDGNDVEIHAYTPRSLQRQGGVVRFGE